jgi:hypothetical protein
VGVSFLGTIFFVSLGLINIIWYLHYWLVIVPFEKGYIHYLLTPIGLTGFVIFYMFLMFFITGIYLLNGVDLIRLKEKARKNMIIISVMTILFILIASQIFSLSFLIMWGRVFLVSYCVYCVAFIIYLSLPSIRKQFSV